MGRHSDGCWGYASGHRQGLSARDNKQRSAVPMVSTVMAKAQGAGPTEEVSPTCWKDRDTSLKEVGLSRVFQDT